PEYSARERLVVALRMRVGIDPADFERGTGYSLVELLGAELPPLLNEGWLEWLDGRLRLTEKALPVADSILAELVA
ncbi:MAG: coproporphyrinogen III oxidase family protein, partial [Planctomycetes bacterium]|nr:coproporphyrinogen III oxidase family protein [Planctomycetota bacterium]